MICTKCAHNNPDDARHCQACGFKLQSARSPRDQDDAPDAPLPHLSGPPPEMRRRAAKYREAWLVAGVLWIVACVLLWTQVYWPLYPLAGLAGIWAWLRGIGWKD